MQIDKDTVLQMFTDIHQGDPYLEKFGARSHGYYLNPPIPIAEIETFEAEHNVTLPEDYRFFITEIGNGGAGPYHGLFRFGEHDDGHEHCRWEVGGLVGDLSQEFPHEEKWNASEAFWERIQSFYREDMSPEEEDRAYELSDKELEKHYWNPSVMNGAIPIAHEGCALRQWLVINGKQKGFVWADHRADRAGIWPVRDNKGNQETFTDWYLPWLTALWKYTWRRKWTT